MTDDIRDFVAFWRRNGSKPMRVEEGVARAESSCGAECCSPTFDLGGLFDALVDLGGWTADTDHEHRWGSKHGNGWRVCEVQGCRMFLPAAPPGETAWPKPLPDDYAKQEEDPCPA